VRLGAAALVVLALAGCSDGGGKDESGDAGVLVVRADGTQVEFSSPPRAYCGPWNEDPATTVLYVETGQGETGEAYWQLVAPASQVSGVSVDLPTEVDADRPRGASLFVYDATDRGNGVASETDGSSGTIAIHSQTCDEGGEIHVSVDAVLGSESQGLPSITVRGEIRARVGAAP
jgi:hypothetical protein